MIQTHLRHLRENQGMVTAKKKRVVILGIGEEEVMVVTMTPHHPPIMGAETRTQTIPVEAGTLAKTEMTLSRRRSTVTGD